MYILRLDLVQVLKFLNNLKLFLRKSSFYLIRNMSWVKIETWKNMLNLMRILWLRLNLLMDFICVLICFQIKTITQGLMIIFQFLNQFLIFFLQVKYKWGLFIELEIKKNYIKFGFFLLLLNIFKHGKSSLFSIIQELLVESLKF